MCLSPRKFPILVDLEVSTCEEFRCRCSMKRLYESSGQVLLNRHTFNSETTLQHGFLQPNLCEVDVFHIPETSPRSDNSICAGVALDDCQC